MAPFGWNYRKVEGWKMTEKQDRKHFSFPTSMFGWEGKKIPLFG